MIDKGCSLINAPKFMQLLKHSAYTIHVGKLRALLGWVVFLNLSATAVATESLELTVLTEAKQAAIPLPMEGDQAQPRTNPLPPSALTITRNGRYFEQNRQPFFWIGDTAWLACRGGLSSAEISSYVKDRAARGFNVIHGCIPLAVFTAVPLDGTGAITSKNPMTLNPDFWNSAEHLISEAQANNMVVVQPLVWGPHTDRIFDTPAEAAEYAALSVKRLSNYPNVVFLPVGEYHKIAWQPADDQPQNGLVTSWVNNNTPLHSCDVRRVRAWVNTIALAVEANKHPDALITEHPDFWRSSGEHFHAESWNDFNMLQSSHSGKENIEDTISDRARSPAKPTVQAELYYEGDDPLGNRHNIREAAYHAWLSGAAGFTHGNGSIWRFRSDWQSELSTDAAIDIASHFKTFVYEHHHAGNMPNQALVNNPGSATQPHRYKAAMLSHDGVRAFLFSPDGGDVDVNTALLSGSKPLQARWYDTRKGTYEIPFLVTRSSSVVLNPPGSPNDANDWALVIEPVP